MKSRISFFVVSLLLGATGDAFLIPHPTTISSRKYEAIRPPALRIPNSNSHNENLSVCVCQQTTNSSSRSLLIGKASASGMDANGETAKNLGRNTPSRRMRYRKVKIYNQKKLQKTGMLLALWYILSMVYNIFSKKVLNMAPELAWTAAWGQMAFGLLYVVPIWTSGLRGKPELNRTDVKRLLPVALLHSLVHVGGVVSMGAGAVSFTYIVKATEPALAAILAALILKSFLPIPVYLTLIPIISGVSLASVSELTFSWKAFNYAMMSNVASASRGIVSKKNMNQRIGKNLNAMNLYGVMTMMATLIIFPFAFALESKLWGSSFKRLVDAGQLTPYVAQLLLTALTYYTYNEVSFMALDNIAPVSHAIASTLRRVFIIVSSMIVFGNKMTPLGAFGSILAVGGAFLYSAAKNYYSEKKT